MGVRSKRRVRRSREEWEGILARHRASGLSELAFCRREKISRSSLAKWRRRIADASPNDGAFIELTTPPRSGAFSENTREFEITLPGDVVLRWKA